MATQIKSFLQTYFTYIRDEDIPTLANWKYIPSEATPVDNIMNPWWVFCQSKTPRWVSANMVSYTAITVCFLSTCFVAAFASTFENRIFCSALSLITMFFYQTMDAVDGKHARSLGMTSPFGSMLDHGCDTLSTFLQATMILHAIDPTLQLNATYFSSALAVLNTFYLVHWACKYEGKLIVEGTTEGQLVSMALLVPNFFYWNGEFYTSDTTCFVAALIINTIVFVIGVLPIFRVLRQFGVSCLAGLLPALGANLITAYLFWNGTFHDRPTVTLGCIGMTFTLISLRYVIGNMANSPMPLSYHMIPVGLLTLGAIVPALLPLLLAVEAILFAYVTVDTTIRVCNGLKIPIILVKIKSDK